MNWVIRPAEFAERATVRDLPLEHAREVLQSPGHDLPRLGLYGGALQDWLKGLPKMPEGQVSGLAQECFEAVKRVR